MPTPYIRFAVLSLAICGPLAGTLRAEVDAGGAVEIHHAEHGYQRRHDEQRPVDVVARATG